jgi:hypothetical protein
LKYNIPTTNIIDLGHPTVKHHFLPALYPSPQSPKRTRHRLTIHEPHRQPDTDDRNYERNLLVHQKNGDVSIAIGDFAYMDRLPNFDDMVAHPALLMPHKIPVDEYAILPYFPNLTEAVPGEFNATPLFIMDAQTCVFRCCCYYTALN